MTEQFRKLRKVPAFKHADISGVVEEVAELQERLVQGDKAQICHYNFHQVYVNGARYLAADARSLNRFSGSRGRGNFRYLFEDTIYVGVAEHTSQNKYRRVA